MRVPILEDDPARRAVLDEIETKAARRLRTWLPQVGSRVRPVDRGRRCHGLHLPA